MIDATVQIGAPIASVRPVAPPANQTPGRATTEGGDAGLDSGSAAAMDQARQALQADRTSLASAKGALLSALQQTAGLKESVVHSAEQQIVELAIHVARKVLMQEIQAGRYEIDPIVQAALEQVSNRQEVVVHLNPDDFQRCAQAKQAGQGEQDDCPAGVRFVADPSVRPAECLLQTPQGNVQSSIEEHLGEIAAALREPE